jgi:hypothetical protein
MFLASSGAPPQCRKGHSCRSALFSRLKTVVFKGTSTYASRIMCLCSLLELQSMYAVCSSFVVAFCVIILWGIKLRSTYCTYDGTYDDTDRAQATHDGQSACARADHACRKHYSIRFAGHFFCSASCRCHLRRR